MCRLPSTAVSETWSTCTSGRVRCWMPTLCLQSMSVSQQHNCWWLRCRFVLKRLVWWKGFANEQIFLVVWLYLILRNLTSLICNKNYIIVFRNCCAEEFIIQLVDLPYYCRQAGSGLDSPYGIINNKKTLGVIDTTLCISTIFTGPYQRALCLQLKNKRWTKYRYTFDWRLQ